MRRNNEDVSGAYGDAGGRKDRRAKASGLAEAFGNDVDARGR